MSRSSITNWLWLLACALVVVVGSHLEVTHSAPQATSEDEATRVEKKITIIVSDEGTATTQELDSPPQPSSEAKRRTKSDGIPTFKIDETTKLIYINKESESGFLFSEIITDRQGNETSTASDVNRLAAAETGSSATNFSVFLVSRRPEHIAILLDIEEIDFEPTLNCDNQEIRFSIIGEISKQLLTQKVEGIDAQPAEEQQSTGGDSAATADAEPEDEEQDESGDSRGSPKNPMPVSEAMALLLNSPLNKTILSELDETNDFKIIDSTIDFLHEKTCVDLINQLAATTTTTKKPQSTNRATNNNTSRARRRKPKNTKQGQRRNRARKHQSRESICSQESPAFKSLMSERLREYFEWDEFKIVCGKIKQLVIPMRSIKIGVFSDEFSPNSSFKLRYKFISDPTVLPAFDNGKYYCRNRIIIDLQLKCNGIDDCGDASDESIKTCGYPTSRSGELTSALVTSPASNRAARASNSSASYAKKKLTYVNGDVLHCCQSSEWLSLMPNAQSNRLNLQSFIGESMNIFSGGPIFAPAGTKTSSATGKGKRRVKRIVGGGVAQKGMWPGQASLQYELLEPLCHFCAGTLIHPQYVLTAGHCITKDGLARGIKVVFGAHDLRRVSNSTSSDNSHVQVRYVDDAHIYPGVDVKQLDFDWENDMNNDIALLRLNAPVLVTAHVAPACLPPFNRPPTVSTSCRSIGWGQTHGSGASNVLKQLSLKVVDSSNCSRELIDQENGGHSPAPRNATTPIKERKRATGSDNFEGSGVDQYSDQTMICVKNDLGHGICQGDSGGPLYCDRVNEQGEKCTEIYGVASFIIQYATVGAMCAVENLPEIFGEVSSKTEWISSTIKMFEQTYKLKYS